MLRTFQMTLVQSDMKNSQFGGSGHVPKMLGRKTLSVCNENLIFLFLSQTYVMGTQKNHLDEMVLLSTQNIC